MHEFRDSQNRTWRLEINVGQIQEVKDALGVNLLDVLGGEMLADLADDPVTLCNVLFVLCREQCQTANVTDRDFGRGLVGDAIDEASNAFLEELVDFFPQRRRGTLKRLLAKVRRMQELDAERADSLLDSDRLERIWRQETEKLDAALDARLSGSSSGSGKPPESSA